MFPWLSVLIFMPLLVSVGLFSFPQNAAKSARFISIAVSGVLLSITIFIAFVFVPGATGYQFTETTNWITLQMAGFGRLSVDYALGIDGMSLGLLLLSQLVFVLALIASASITSKQTSFYATMLFLQATINGCFVSLDLFLFFLFFELMLLPMYFLIGIWGGPRREYASIKFFIYTLLGSVFILVAFIMMYLSFKDPSESALYDITHTFRIDYIQQTANLLAGSVLHPDNLQMLGGIHFRVWAFLLLFVGFCIKLPAFPFHTWLPDAHVEAPTPVSVILAAVLLKIGAYGFLRIAYPVFPDAAVLCAPYVAGMGMVSIIYAAYNALAQYDLKKMIAYSSVSHMGFVLLGIASNQTAGITGAYYQLISHGLLSAGLFLAAGVVYDRAHDRTITNFKGLANAMPAFTGVVIVLFFASFGLPGFSGFIAEVLVLMGSYASPIVPTWITLTALVGLVIGAAYYLWTLQRMFFGTFWVKEGLTSNQQMPDLNLREWFLFVPLVLLIILLGVMPNALLYFTEGLFEPF